MTNGYVTVIRLTGGRVVTFGPASRRDVLKVERAVTDCMHGRAPWVEIHGNNGTNVRAWTDEIVSVGL